MSLVVQIQYCKNCHLHSWCSRHDEIKYIDFFQQLCHKIEIQIANVTVGERKKPDYLQLKKSTVAQLNQYVNIQNGRQQIFPRSGAFEVYADNYRIFSKIKTKKWPKFDKIIEILRKIIEAKNNGQSIAHFDVDYTETPLNQEQKVTNAQLYDIKAIFRVRKNRQDPQHLSRTLDATGLRYNNNQVYDTISGTNPEKRLSYYEEKQHKTIDKKNVRLQKIGLRNKKNKNVYLEEIYPRVGIALQAKRRKLLLIHNEEENSIIIENEDGKKQIYRKQITNKPSTRSNRRRLTPIDRDSLDIDNNQDNDALHKKSNPLNPYLSSQNYGYRQQKMIAKKKKKQQKNNNFLQALDNNEDKKNTIVNQQQSNINQKQKTQKQEQQENQYKKHDTENNENLQKQQEEIIDQKSNKDEQIDIISQKHSNQSNKQDIQYENNTDKFDEQINEKSSQKAELQNYKQQSEEEEVEKIQLQQQKQSKNHDDQKQQYNEKIQNEEKQIQEQQQQEIDNREIQVIEFDRIWNAKYIDKEYHLISAEKPQIENAQKNNGQKLQAQIEEEKHQEAPKQQSTKLKEDLILNTEQEIVQDKKQVVKSDKQVIKEKQILIEKKENVKQQSAFIQNKEQDEREQLQYSKDSDDERAKKNNNKQATIVNKQSPQLQENLEIVQWETNIHKNQCIIHRKGEIISQEEQKQINGPKIQFSEPSRKLQTSSQQYVWDAIYDHQTYKLLKA